MQTVEQYAPTILQMDHLSTEEVISTMLSNNRSPDLLDRLVNTFGNLNAAAKKLCTMTGTELALLGKVSINEAWRILSAIELGKRVSFLSSGTLTKVRNPKDVARFLLTHMRLYDREHFIVILVNTQNEIICVETVAVGGLAHTAIHPREVFKGAIRHSASAVILAHNHPSGCCEPSGADIKVTQRLAKAGTLLGICVLDHLIIGDGVFTSMRDKMMID
ncbi:MAG: DNA repair protein RadC [Limnochordia bacterium]|nr:DNA repair protein RadC [Limnochordia bacterium]